MYMIEFGRASAATRFYRLSASWPARGRLACPARFDRQAGSSCTAGAGTVLCLEGAPASLRRARQARLAISPATASTTVSGAFPPNRDCA
jgi:hypothetical protein